MRNVAVILAGGVGTRMGGTMPKQFFKVSGKTVLEHTISVFDNHPLIDEIAIVVHPNYLEKVEELCCINNFKKVGRILQGGSERYYSSLSAINAYASTENDINLIFHDSVRPLVTKRIISDCITMLGKYGAVDVAIPATDTIIKMNLNTHEIEDIPNRQFLYNGQTPQAFKLSVIREAYKRALVDPNFKTTDDCGVVLKYMPDIPIGVVPGEKFNMKLTHKEDLFLLDKLFQLKSVSDVSLYGQETALEHKVIVIFGGSYGIGHSIAELCTGLKAKVYSFSRSETGTDVADASLVKEALEKVYLIEKKIDFVINTAGILLKIPLMTMKYDDILNLIRVNYLGAINVAKESFSYLAKSHGGLLLFTSSSYTRGRAMYSLYSSSKAAIVNLVQALSEEWKSYNENKSYPLLNKCIQSAYEPGSIFKMVTAIAGLESGNISLTEKINDTGVYKKYGAEWKCWYYTDYHRGHGYLNVIGAIEKSCNFFFYETADRMGIDTLDKYATYFGLGRKTGIELPSETAGTLASKDYVKSIKGSWNPGDTINAAIGQGYNKFTPLQMTKYISMIANGGNNVNVSIVKTIQNADGTEVSKDEINEYVKEKLGLTEENTENITLNKDYVNAVREGMKSVTSGESGTAYVRFKDFNIKVGGKTGSAEAGKDANGNDIVNAWFAAFAPYDDPEIAVVVMVENGGHGNYTAEAVRNIMAEYFGMNTQNVTEDMQAVSYTESMR